MKTFLKILIPALIVITAFVIYITRDGGVITPSGEGEIVLDSGAYEAYPLPDYAAKMIDSDYKSYFIEVEPDIKVHILEVGEGFPVYLQHGNPTSGFLYRKVAAELKGRQVRLIMPTMVGLGFSSKIPASRHTLDNHVRWMAEVLKQLQLSELIFVGQDWGGPIGMGALALNPEMLRGAVILNTALNAPTEVRDISAAHALAKTPVLGELMFEVLVSIFDRLPDVQGDPLSMPSEVLELYGRPVTESGNGKAPLTLMRMVTDGPDHPSTPQLRLIEDYVESLDIPAEIVWGMNDPVLGRLLPNMKANFPDAPVTETAAGHFLQEEVPGDIANALIRIIDKIEDNSIK
ncbi:MAG: alpha/beta fold hydrolase [Gammaproteobacteria bacterium AqS3]|nr:alpha/beta fold hydrolase [Gammaproteobacteria bacterium AqS3]